MNVIEKLNKLRVEEIQMTYDVFISHLKAEKKAREQTVEKERQLLDETARKLEQAIADKAKQNAMQEEQENEEHGEDGDAPGVRENADGEIEEGK